MKKDQMLNVTRGKTAMGRKYIEIRSLCKSFDKKVLFRDFECSVGKGEFVVITGNSGCGKTTLLNMIGGLEPVTSGKILVDGLDITVQRNLRRYYRDVVGFVFQNFALVEQKTVEENLNMVHRSGRSAVTAEQALASVGLKDVLKQKVHALSGGEQQRAALARLRMKKCDLILADEPTGSLDRKNGEKVMEILHGMNDEGKTVIMVTHDETLIRESDRVIRLSS